MHLSHIPKCAYFCSEWCILGQGTGALCDLLIWSVELVLHLALDITHTPVYVSHSILDWVSKWLMLIIRVRIDSPILLWLYSHPVDINYKISCLFYIPICQCQGTLMCEEWTAFVKVLVFEFERFQIIWQIYHHFFLSQNFSMKVGLKI